MRMRRLLFVVTVAGVLLVMAGAAFAQSTSVTGTGSTGTSTGVSNLPGMGSLPTRQPSAAASAVGAATPTRTGTAGRAAPARRASDPTRLPATGTPVVVYGLLGIVLVAAGRMLVELAPAIRRS